GGECGPEIAAELGGVPTHEPARRALASDSRDDRHHLREGRHAVEDAADLLELVAEALERLGPALRELSPDGLRLHARALGPPGRRRGREAARLAELGADPRHALRTRGHRGVSLSSSIQGSIRFSSTWRRSSMSMRGISIRTGHASAHAPQSEEACASSFTEPGPLSIAVNNIPIGPGYVWP